MILLGIDPGTARTGYAFVDYSTSVPKLTHAGVIITEKDTDMHDRLHILYKSLNQMCKEFRPKQMIIERLFFNTNAKTAIAVGQARGVSLLVGAQYKMDVAEYTALQAKTVLTGYGRSEKREVQDAIKSYFRLADILKPDDASDAAAMVVCHIEKVYVANKAS